MLSNSALIINKVQKDLPDCSQNAIEIEGSLFCLKCKQDRPNGKLRRFTNCRSLFFHLTHDHGHSSADKNCYPKTEDCIAMLQIISNAIVLGVLK